MSTTIKYRFETNSLYPPTHQSSGKPPLLCPPQFGSGSECHCVSEMSFTHKHRHICTYSLGKWNGIQKVFKKKKYICFISIWPCLARGWGLQMTVQAVWDGSYVGQPAHVCFWVKPHCPRCCLSKHGQRGRGLFVSCKAGAKPNINTHTK